MSISLPDLLQELSRRYDWVLPEWDERGVALLSVDGSYEVTLRADGEQIVLEAEVGAVPAFGRAACLERMLQARFARLTRQSELLYLDQGDEPVFRLRQNMPLADLDVRKLEERLEGFFNCLDFWHRQLHHQTSSSLPAGMLCP